MQSLRRLQSPSRDKSATCRYEGIYSSSLSHIGVQQGWGCIISTLKPTTLFATTGLEGSESLAAEVETEILAIIDEAV
jgi:hypothetical protein